MRGLSRPPAQVTRRTAARRGGAAPRPRTGRARPDSASRCRREERARRAGCTASALPSRPASPWRLQAEEGRRLGSSRAITGARRCPLHGCGAGCLLPRQLGGPGLEQTLRPRGSGACPLTRPGEAPLPPLRSPPASAALLPLLTLLPRCGVSAALTPQHGEAQRPRGKLPLLGGKGRGGEASSAGPRPPPSAAAHRP